MIFIPKVTIPLFRLAADPASQRANPDLPGKPSHGFTLVEILVALSIIAVVLVAVYRLQALNLSMTHTVQFNTIAPLLAQLKLAQAEQTGLGDSLNESGDFGESYPGYSWQLEVESAQQAGGDGVMERLAKIDVRVALEGSNEVLHVTTYRLVAE